MGGETTGGLDTVLGPWPVVGRPLMPQFGGFASILIELYQAARSSMS